MLKVTPSVHDQGEVTLDIESEFKVLGATDANGNPSISSRKYAGKVRLRMDESAVVAGLMGSRRTEHDHQRDFRRRQHSLARPSAAHEQPQQEFGPGAVGAASAPGEHAAMGIRDDADLGGHGDEAAHIVLRSSQ